MNFIRSENADEGTKALAVKIISALKRGSRVLWLIPGGSNIPISVTVEKILRREINSEELGRLSITLTDERYGPDGHDDSNWRQLADQGFDFSGMSAMPVLCGLPLPETAATYSKNISDVFDQVDIVVGQFGIGDDGHIAGILPGSPAVSSDIFTAGSDGSVVMDDRVCAYAAGRFTRITLIAAILRKIDCAFAFAFGPAKRKAIRNLQGSDLPLVEQPAAILKSLPEAYLYSDQIG